MWINSGRKVYDVTRTISSRRFICKQQHQVAIQDQFTEINLQSLLKMTSLRILRRAIRPPTFSTRAFTTTPLRFSDNPNYTSNNNPGNATTHVGTEEHRKIQSS